MIGRPKQFTQARPVSVNLEQSTYAVLAEEMLDRHRRRYPGAKLGDLLRHLLDQAIRDYRRAKAGEQDASERERRLLQKRLRRLALADAPGPELEATALRLAELRETK